MPTMVRIFFSLLVPATVCLQAADLRGIRSVYAWPMTKSFDQYLAQQITAEDVFDVVVDPKLAGAILTDRIDAPFLAAMDELFPLPEDEAAQAAEDEAADTAESDESIEAGGAMKRPKNRVLGRPRGTLFLVDVRSRKVVWSTYLKEYEPTPNKLNQLARGVVEDLKQAAGFAP